MATGIADRLLFAAGLLAFGVATATGLAAALHATGRPPGLLVDPLVEAQREFAGRDRERWIREARSLTEIQPRNQGAQLALGRALADAERDAEAIRAYEAALALGPVPPVAHAQLARLYWREGDRAAARDQARIARERGVAFSPEFQRALDLSGPGAS